MEPDVAPLTYISADKYGSDVVYGKYYCPALWLFESPKPNRDGDETSGRKHCLGFSAQVKVLCAAKLSN